MIVAYFPLSGNDNQRPGHYFSCEECGWVAPIRTGDGSRARACEDARRHDVAKSMADLDGKR